MSEPTQPKGPRGAKPAPPPSFGHFVVRLMVYLFLTSLLFSLGQLHLHMGPLQRVMARGVGAASNWFGAGATVDGSLIHVEHGGLEINHECTGVFVLLVYAMFVLAYPAPWQQRFYGITVGIIVLMAINVARLVALVVIASRYPSWFGYFHEYFFQGLFIALLAFLASVWTEQVRRATLPRVSA
jgi:archaeosortase B (VPXXXP-CTERM-specific)